MIVTEIEIIISSVAWSSFAAIMCGAYLGRSPAQRPLTLAVQLVQRWMNTLCSSVLMRYNFFGLEES